MHFSHRVDKDTYRNRIEFRRLNRRGNRDPFGRVGFRKKVLTRILGWRNQFTRPERRRRMLSGSRIIGVLFVSLSASELQESWGEKGAQKTILCEATKCLREGP